MPQIDATALVEVVETYAFGARRDAPREQAKAAVRAVSDDPAVLGEVLGDYLHRVVTGTQAETVRYWPVLDLLRASGADEDVARERASSLRQRL